MAQGIGKGFGALVKALGNSMKDDKGLFQGGEQGRSFGRIKDALGVASRDEFGNKITQENMMQDTSAQDELYGQARSFAENLNTQDNEEVLEMQNMLNQLGIKDAEGKTLKADGILGGKTLHALRQLQGVDTEPSDMYQESYEYEPGKAPSGPTGIVDEPTEGESVLMGKPQGNTGRSWQDWLFKGAGGIMNERFRSAAENIPKNFDKWKALTGVGGGNSRMSLREQMELNKKINE
tara:strand:+ start:105 stop:812 length:708 start_codon:yes stop_codon:yes gene_type:complete